MKCQILTVLSVSALCLSVVLGTKLTDVTDSVFTEGNIHSYLAAYGDNNADKMVDIFLINDKGVSFYFCQAYF